MSNVTKPDPKRGRTGLSPYITSPDVAFFIGAGASRNFGFRLMGGPDYQGLLQKYRNALSDPEVADLIGSIEASEPSPSNMEDVFEQVELLARAATTLRSCPTQDSCPLASAAERAKKAIEAFVGECYGCPQEAERRDALKTYRELFEDFWKSAHASVIPVFTTNYDWLLEYVCYDGDYRLVTGFESAYREWDPNVLHGLERGGQTLVVAKLHGSSGWQRSRRLDNTERVVAPTPGASAFVSEARSHALVAPVRSKAPEGDIALTYFAYLEECLARSHAFVIIGYALNELGVRNAFATGLLRREGDPLKVAVVDVAPEPVVERLKKECPEGAFEATAIQHEFGSSTSSDIGSKLQGWLGRDRPPDEIGPATGMASRKAIETTVADPLTGSMRGTFELFDSDPPDMFRPTLEGACAEWRNSTVFSRSGYWELRRPIQFAEFTISVEVCPESVGAGWDPGVSVMDDTGEITVIATRVIPANLGGNPLPHDAMCLLREGPRGADKDVLAAAPVKKGPGEWNQVTLQVSGRRARHSVNGKPSEWHDTHALPSIVRLGPFACHRSARGTGDPARYLFRNFELRFGL